MRRQPLRCVFLLACALALTCGRPPSFAAVPPAQTPWRAAASGATATLPPVAACGYELVPLKAGSITALALRAQGRRRVRLLEAGSGRVLATVDIVSSAGGWVSAPLPRPVPVVTGRTYAVVVDLGGSGGTQQVGLSRRLPLVSGDVRILRSFLSRNAALPYFPPPAGYVDRMLGQVDVAFVPAVAPEPPPAPPAVGAVRVTRTAGTSADVEFTTDRPVASALVRYGPTSAYGSAVAVPVGPGTAFAATLAPLPGLSDVHFSVEVRDAGGRIGRSPDMALRTGSPGPCSVTIRGYQVFYRPRLRDGSLGPEVLLTLPAVNYTPASRDTNTWGADPNNAAVRRREFGKWWAKDLLLLIGMRVKVIRLALDPGIAEDGGVAGRQFLDALYEAGISVIMTADNGANDMVRIGQVVPYYADHPAVLFFSLGSELNINRYFGAAPTVAEAARRTELAAALIRSLDPVHPVVASWGELDFGAPGSGTTLADTARHVNVTCPSVGLWSVNVFRGAGVGNLFAQWKSISAKPMFLGEWMGADAWDSRGGRVDEVAQAQRAEAIWAEVWRNLSARDSSAVCLGGAYAFFSDEWWKVYPAGAQSVGGWANAAFPDGFVSEEYLGALDIDRRPRQVYFSLAKVYAPGWVPPAPPAAPAAVVRVDAAGSLAQENPWQHGYVRIYVDGRLVHDRAGGGGGGRGFTAARLTPAGGVVEIRNFDTWGTYGARDALAAWLEALPAGTPVMLAVGDEAGLTYSAPGRDNEFFPEPSVARLLRVLEQMGSQEIRNYHYWDSWSMAAVKGEGRARAEQRARARAVRVELAFPLR